MKKITVWFLCLLMLAMPMSLTACKSDEEGVIRLSEVTHSIFYAPLYVAINNGYFEDEGITIELSNAGGADKVMTAIASKSVDFPVPFSPTKNVTGEEKDISFSFLRYFITGKLLR